MTSKCDKCGRALSLLNHVCKPLAIGDVCTVTHIPLRAIQWGVLIGDTAHIVGKPFPSGNDWLVLIRIGDLYLLWSIDHLSAPVIAKAHLRLHYSCDDTKMPWFVCHGLTKRTRSYRTSREAIEAANMRWL